MSELFYKPNWSYWQVLVSSLCSILDGIVGILGLGFVWSCFEYKWVKYMIYRRGMMSKG